MTSTFGIPVANDTYEGGDGGEVYLKKVCAKAPVQRLRILQPVDTMIKWFEHYEEGPGAFYCMNSSIPKIETIYADPSACPVCTEIAKNSRDLATFTTKIKEARKILYASNALEQSGRLSVFKFGSSVKKNLQTKEQLRGTIMDRDVSIMKSGTGLGTEYNVESEDAYEIDWPKEIYNIQNALARQWIEAMASYDFPVDPNLADAVSAKMTPGFRPVRTGPAVVEHHVLGPDAHVPSTQGVAFGKSDEAQATATSGQNPETGETPEDYNQWDVTTIKAFLDSRKIEYPDRSARSRLLGIMAKHIESNPTDDLSMPEHDLSEPPF